MTTHRITTAADVLADGVDATVIGGTAIRKGTVAAFIANATALGAVAAGSEEFHAIAAEIRAAKPALDALGIFDVLAVRDPRVAAALTDAP